MEIRESPEYTSCVDPLSEEEYNTLRESIQKEGLLDPIIVNEDGEILDGHHRYSICKELGITPKYIIRPSKDKLEEKLFVLTYNNARRHYNKFQKIEQVLKAKPVLQKIAKRNESLGGKGGEIKSPLGRVNDEIGRRAGVGKDTIRKVEKILKSAPPELLAKVRTEEISVNQAYNGITFAEQKTKQQKKLQEEYASDSERILSELDKINDERISLLSLRTGEGFIKLPEQERNRIDLNCKRKIQEDNQKRREYNMLCNKVWFDNEFLAARDPRSQDLFRKLSYLSQHEPETMEQIFITLNKLPESSEENSTPNSNENED